MPYTLKFSDPNKNTTITVPDMPPGINFVDTSLSLVGRGYPNYGQKYAENFLHLLENFSSPFPPQNPIEGQLWYDTSDPTRKVLRIMDGTTDAARWPSATGIYQQDLDPKDTNTVALKVGDIWVDTVNNQLKIFNDDNWTTVGPNTSTNSGPFVVTLNDTSSTYTVIQNRINGNIVSIIANDNFAPNPVITGFGSLITGTNLAENAILNGTALYARNLEISGARYAASAFLRKDDQTLNGQVITGKIFFKTQATQTGSQGRDGIVIGIDGSVNNYIQLYKNSNDGVLLNNTPSGKLLFRLPDTNNVLKTTMSISNGSVAINTATSQASPALDVYGKVRISSTLSVTSTLSNAIEVSGGITVAKDISVNENLYVTGNTNFVGTLTLGASSAGSIIVPNSTGTYDIGSANYPFRDVYATGRIGSTSSVIYGKIATVNMSGMIMSYATNTNIPSGWLLCDGSAYSQSGYIELFTVIGTSYGDDGTGTFRVPDLSTATITPYGNLTYIIKT